MMIGQSATLPSSSSSSSSSSRRRGGGGEDKKSERRPVFTRRGNLSTRRRRTSVSSSISSSSSQEEKLYTPPQPLPDGPLITLERRANKFIVDSAVFVIDKLYEGRDYPRFYALETIARVPYFSFLSVLHLYESFGWWRRADYLKVHFAETMNEYHHLLIMEAMGGAERLAQNAVLDALLKRQSEEKKVIAAMCAAPAVVLLSKNLLAEASEATAHPAFDLGEAFAKDKKKRVCYSCLLYTSPSPRDGLLSRMPSSA